MPKSDRDFEALHRFLEERLNMPHEWGRHANDCCSFPIMAVEAQTGRNLVTDLEWSNRAEAVEVIKELGGLEKAIDRYLVRIPPSLAMRGDIAGVEDPTFGIHPMLVDGELLVAPSDKGLRRAPRRKMIMAWSAVLPKPSEDSADE